MLGFGLGCRKLGCGNLWQKSFITRAMAQKPRLHYFNAPGRAECIRLAFHLGGIEFDDVRFSKEDWPSIKPTVIPSHTVPKLELDGENYFESLAIFAYAGEKAGLFPRDDPVMTMKVWQLIMKCEDLRMSNRLLLRSTPEEMPAVREKQTVMVPEHLRILEAYVKQFQDTKTGHAVTDKLTAADLIIFPIVALWRSDPYKLGYKFDYPSLQKCHDAAIAHPKIQEYLQKQQK